MPAPGDSGGQHFVGARLTVEKAEIGQLTATSSESLFLDTGGALINMLGSKYRAIGTWDPIAGTGDARGAIVQGQADAQGPPGSGLFFPPGRYNASDYIDVAGGTYWTGVGLDPSNPPPGATLFATGTNKGVVRFRPGTPGQLTILGGQREVQLENLGFSGTGSTTGHLVTVARASHLRFRNCFFNNTNGQGFKDDNVTLVGAAGVYGYSCEVVSFDSCNFENNLNATGAAVTLEDGCHGWSWSGECHFNGNTYGIRCIAFTAGLGTGGLYLANPFFYGNKTAFFCDAGGVHTVSCWGGWFEAHTAVNPAAQIIDGGTSAGPLNAWNFIDTTVNFTVAGTKVFVANVQMDNSSFISCRFNGVGTVSLFVQGTVSGGNVLISPAMIGITNVFSGNDPATSGFSFANGQVNASYLTSPVTMAGTALHQKRVTLTDGANVNINLALGNDFFLAAAGSRTINNYTNPPAIGSAQIFSVTISNTTGGAITTTWGSAYHLAAAWVDPGTLKQRTIFFRLDGTTGVAYELSRNSADVTP